MKFTRFYSLFSACILMSNAHAADVSATLTINVSFLKPTCTIDVPSTYNLGILHLNQTQEHAPLILHWSCNDAEGVETGLTASVVSGVLGPTLDNIKMLNNDGSENSSRLSFKEQNSQTKIKLTGADDDAFCSSRLTGGRHCKLIPITQTQADSRAGRIYSTIRFTVVYQ